MNGTQFLKVLGSVPKEYSPITLNTSWPTLWRLIIIFFSAFIGTMINGFFVAAFFIEDNLRKIGNVYLACSGLADMIITTSVMPTAVVVLISGQWDVRPVCQAAQILTQAATYAYSLFFMMVSFESYFRVIKDQQVYCMFTKIPIVIISLSIFVISFIVSLVGVYYDMDYDYCKRNNLGNYPFRLTTLIIMHVLPCVIITILLYSTAYLVRARARKVRQYQRSEQYERDYTSTNLNIICYTLFVCGWTPYLIIITLYPTASDSKFYNFAWLGIFRSILTSFFYNCLNADFRIAFTHLFYYCCCRSSISTPFINRHRRTFQNGLPTRDIRVHLMHHSLMVSHNSQRAGRERQEHIVLEL